MNQATLRRAVGLFDLAVVVVAFVVALTAQHGTVAHTGAMIFVGLVLVDFLIIIGDSVRNDEESRASPHLAIAAALVLGGAVVCLALIVAAPSDTARLVGAGVLATGALLVGLLFLIDRGMQALGRLLERVEREQAATEDEMEAAEDEQDQAGIPVRRVTRPPVERPPAHVVDLVDEERRRAGRRPFG